MRTVPVLKRLLPSLGGLALLLWLSAVPGWAGFEEGIQAYKKGDYATAARAWLPLAQQGDARAQFLLGSLYAQGYGVPQDYGTAAQQLPIMVQHGSRDELIDVGRARQSVEALRPLHLAVTYREYEMGHEISGRSLLDLSAWLEEKVLSSVITQG